MWCNQSEEEKEDAPSHLKEMAKLFQGLLPPNSRFHFGQLNAFEAWAQLRQREIHQPGITLDERYMNLSSYMHDIVQQCYGSELDAFFQSVIARMNVSTLDLKRISRFYPRSTEFIPLRHDKLVKARLEYERFVRDPEDYTINPFAWETYVKEFTLTMYRMMYEGMDHEQIAEEYFEVPLSHCITLEVHEQRLQAYRTTKLVPPEPPTTTVPYLPCIVL
jgi:hypothetical protein